jgi:hypothetical protein
LNCEGVDSDLAVQPLPRYAALVHDRPIAISLLALAACAAGTQARPAAPAPAPEPGHAAPELRVAQELEPVTLACRTAELPLPNALDDNCDGLVDGVGRDAALTLAWASAGGAELDVSLLDASGQAIAARHEQRAPACPEDGAALASSKVYAVLPAHAARVVLRQVRACGESPATVSVVVAFGTPAGSRSYLLTLPPDQPVTLAELVAR